MPQPKKGSRLGSDPKHQRQMLSNLALSLFRHERIRTTEAKAKLLRPYAERIITKAKRGGLHHRRAVLALIEDRAVVHKLFDDIGPRFAARNGGYTRILKLGPRQGDGAAMALIELVEDAAVTAAETGEATSRRRLRRPGRRRPAQAAAGDDIESGQAPEKSPGDEDSTPDEQPGDSEADSTQDTPGSDEEKQDR